MYEKIIELYSKMCSTFGNTGLSPTFLIMNDELFEFQNLVYPLQNRDHIDNQAVNPSR
jgi:hypothetical protein